MNNIQKNKSQILIKKTVQDLVSILTNPQKQLHFKTLQQPHLQKQDIAKIFKIKKWKDSGHSKGQFSPAPILKAKILTEWQIQRTSLSKRSYNSPSNFKGLKIHHFSKLFPQIKDTAYPTKFRQHLRKARFQYQDKQFTPNKMMTELNKKSPQSLILKKNNSQMRFHTSKSNLFGFLSIKQNNGSFSTNNLTSKVNKVEIVNKN